MNISNCWCETDPNTVEHFHFQSVPREVGHVTSNASELPSFVSNSKGNGANLRSPATRSPNCHDRP